MLCTASNTLGDHFWGRKVGRRGSSCAYYSDCEEEILEDNSLVLFQQHLSQLNEDIQSQLPGSQVNIELEENQLHGHVLASLVEEVREALEFHPPILCEEGVSGCYFLTDKEDNLIAVFKPTDEEPFADNNPKESSQSEGSARKGIAAGEAAMREVAAFLLDHHHFAEVPPTAMVRCSHSAFHSADESPLNPTVKTKLGSLQQYVPHHCTSGDLGTSLFPVREVHKIGVLDIRICNIDRHEGNILVQKLEREDGSETYKLIPIDHGFSLPNSLDEAWFEWLNWPQAKLKFDDATKDYISHLDAEEDIDLLRRELPGIKEECLEVMKITTTLLKKGAAADLSLFEIGSMICRKDLNTPSELEMLCAAARSRATTSEASYFECLCQLLDDAVKEKNGGRSCIAIVP